MTHDISPRGHQTVRIICTSVLLSLLIFLPSTAEEHTSENDYGRMHIGGMKGPIKWVSLLRGAGLSGWRTKNKAVWSRQGDTLTVRSGQNRYTGLSIGDTTWVNYELKVAATFVKGSNLQIQFRKSYTGKGHYFLDFLTGWKAISITKKVGGVPGVTKLDVVNFPFEFGREYDIVIAVRGESIQTYIDGQLVNRLTNGFRKRGGITLATWGHNTVVHFRDPRVRHYQ